MTIDAAQAEYDGALQVFVFAKAEVIAAYDQTQEIQRDLECGVIRSDDSSIAAVDKVFCAARLAMTQAREAIAAAEGRLAEAHRPPLQPPFEVSLGKATAADSPYVVRYTRDLAREQDAVDEEARVKARQALRKTRSVIMSVFPPMGAA